MYLRTFGGLSLENGPTPPSGAALHQSRLAILAVIAVAGTRGITRDELYALFWPESSIERARGALKQALFALRRDLDTRPLTVGRTTLRLNDSVITSDIDRFLEALNRKDYLAAVEIHAGEFLHGVQIRESQEFELWATRERERFASAFHGALEKLAIDAESAGDIEKGLAWWKRLAQAQPFASKASLRYMSALVASGNREDAIRHGLRYCERIRAELDAVPETEITDFISELRTTSSLPCGSRRSTHVDASSTGPSGHRMLRGTLTLQAATASRPSRVLVVLRNALVVALGAIGAFAAITGFTHRGDDELAREFVRVGAFESSPAHDSILDARVKTVRNALSSQLVDWGLLRMDDPLAHPQRNAKESIGTTISASVWKAGDSVTFGATLLDSKTNMNVGTVNPVRVRWEDFFTGERILFDELGAMLGRPLERRLTPLMGPPSIFPAPAAYRRYQTGIAFAHAREFALNRFVGPAFEAAYAEDTMFATALLAEAFAYRERDSLAYEVRKLAILDRRRARLSILNRHGLSFLIFEANGDAAGRLQAALAASDVAPQSEWSLEAARLLVDSDRPSDAVKYVKRFEKGLDPRSNSIATPRYWLLKVEALHRLGDRNAEGQAIRDALSAGDTSLPMKYALARRLVLDGKTNEGVNVVRNMIQSFGSDGLAAIVDLEMEIRCHRLPSYRNLSATLRFMTKDSVRLDATLARSQANEALSRGAWWFAQYRFRVLADSFPRSLTPVDRARAAFVDANMLDPSPADAFLRKAYPRPRYWGDGEEEYWIAATLAARGRVRGAELLLETVRRKGYPRLSGGHVQSPELDLFRKYHLIAQRSDCSESN